MSIFLEQYQPKFLMQEAGGDGGAGAGGGEGGDAGTGAASATTDGTGGKAPFGQTADKSEVTGKEGGGDGKLDLKTILGEDLVKDQNIAKFLKTENPVQELAKSLLEAQKQIGKPKVGVPGENATAEEKAAFFKSLGVPDDSKGYDFKKPDGLPDEAYNPDHAAKWADLMKANNVPKAAANALRNAMMEEMAGQAEASTKVLNEALDKTFGAKKAEISKEVGDLMAKAIPDAKLRETIQASISNEQTPAFALALGLAMQHMKKTYGMADKNIGDGGEGSGMSIEDLRAKGNKIMSSDAYRDPMHRDHASVKKEAGEIYKQIGELTNQKSKK